MVVSAWSPTVGIAGWTLGGGHGPYNPKHGLGADQLEEVEIVTADGNIVTANKQINTDLLQALRGGGGSTWGVLTSMTVRTHELPVGGFVRAGIYLTGDYCTGESQLLSIVDAYVSWAAELDLNWGGLVEILQNNTNPTVSRACNNWILLLVYDFQGSKSDPNFEENWPKLTAAFPSNAVIAAMEYPTPWSVFETLAPEVIVPLEYLEPRDGYIGSIPSVMIGTDEVANATRLFKSFLTGCSTRNCSTLEIMQDVTGNIGSPQDPFTSVNPGMRSGLFHVIFSRGNVDQFYALGRYSYFGECAYDMPDWESRLWGPHFERLSETKRKWDPNGLFHCRHCVGDENSFT